LTLAFKLIDEEDHLIRPDPIGFKNEKSPDFLKTLQYIDPGFETDGRGGPSQRFFKNEKILEF
jgi:hypothetical protein